MKRGLSALSLLAFLSLGLVFVGTGCAKPKEVETAKKEYTCPMHPEVLKDGPGKCPKCGMALKPK